MPTYPIKVNNYTIKTPSEFKIGRYNITDSGRLASGFMRILLRSKKVKLFLKYDGITGTELKAILDRIDGTAMTFNVTYYETTNAATTKTFYVGDISQTLQRRAYISDESVWKDIEFNFIEQ